jgi:hypothetical protein
MIALIAMPRIWLLASFAAILVLGQAGLPDPAFDNIPFEQWLKGSDEARIEWSLRVFPPLLSESQRLESAIWAVVDASEFAKRPEPGRMVLFFEIRDQENRTYRSHKPLILKNPTRLADLKDVRSSEHLCILPGEYDVAVAVYDSRSKEHSLKRMKLRVPELPRDLLRDAWTGLPSVEISRLCTPRIASRPSLTLSTEKALRVEVIANANLNRDPKTGELSLDANVTPRLVFISRMQIPNGSMHLTALDLEHRKVTWSGRSGFQQGKAGPYWFSSGGNDRRTINARGMEGYKDDAQFFVSQVRKRLESGAPSAEPATLIVISAPLAFKKEVDLTPIQTTGPPGSRVFYIRCKSVSFSAAGPPMSIPSPAEWSAPSLSHDPPRPRVPYTNNSDSLVGMLKPIQPQVFDVTTAADFRNALGTILREIAGPK